MCIYHIHAYIYIYIYIYIYTQTHNVSNICKYDKDLMYIIYVLYLCT